MNDFLKTDQWKSGSKVADFLDAFFRVRGWQIEPTTPHQERVLYLGDRIFTRGARKLFVEYKSGVQSYFTGNIFLETVSVDTQHVAGWVYTCHADMLLYAALLNHKILVFYPDDLRRALRGLKERFKEVQTGKGQNRTYNTHGLLVPMDYAERELARKVIVTEES